MSTASGSANMIVHEERRESDVEPLYPHTEEEKSTLIHSTKVVADTDDVLAEDVGNIADVSKRVGVISHNEGAVVESIPPEPSH
ncbi:hypothetical protein K7X08_034021 [Anisodus acutangulus]|uniref:Uncharacterized protein n=1 Tax=Anisodus acutangulus TaxID=402998 RepID=A0A9Q1RIL8_9SOLA|nr:hypothetical protein K7X08_034021 [Anisodus acutangulus]